MVRKVLLMTAVAACAVAAPTGAAAPADQPIASNTPGAVVAAAHRITPEAALAAAKIPGSTTEVAPGLTLRQAVGLDPTRRLMRRLATTECWNTSGQLSWDFYPWDRHLTDTTSWCGSGGILTYRSSHAMQGQTACAPHGVSGFKLAGGAGENYVAWREVGNWSCPSAVPWITFYATDWMSIYANGSGGYWIYERGGN